MPKNTFLNLEESKKERLVNAIKSELSRVTFDKISINNIIKNAGIPRGSFYQYFIDKKDMLFYILDDYRKIIIEHIKNVIIENNADIFLMFQEILNFTFKFGSVKERYSFYKNILSDRQIAMEIYIKTYEVEINNTIKRFMNKDNLNILNQDDIDNIISILSLITKDTIINVFQDISNYEIIKEKYLKKIELIKYGVLKK